MKKKKHIHQIKSRLLLLTMFVFYEVATNRREISKGGQA